MIDCPHCRNPLGSPAASGVLDATCASCGYAYHILTGHLVGQSSREVTLTAATVQSAGSYEREYQLRISLAGDRLMAVTFRMSGRDEAIFLERDDLVSTIAMRGRGEALDVVEVVDHTTGAVYRVRDPAEPVIRKARGAAVIGGLAAGLLSAPLLGPWAILLGAGSAAAAYVAVRRVSSPLASLDEATVRALARSQGLLEQKASLARERQSVLRELREREALRDRLLALLEKMEDVGRGLYGSRIDTITRAVGLLDQQLDVSRRLLEGYDRTQKIVDIEIESGATVGAMADDGEAILVARREELESLRRRHEELTRLLEANEEVERVLGA